MKLSLFLTLFAFGASTLCSFSQTPPHLRTLMDAVEERHDAAEEMLATTFKLLNKYHEDIMAVDGAFFYSEADGSVHRDYRDSIREGFEEPKFEFNFTLTVGDYAESAPPVKKFTYLENDDPEVEQQNKDDAEDARQAIIDPAQAAYDTEDETVYDASGDRNTDPTLVPNTIAYRKAAWLWAINARKLWIEKGEESPAFDGQLGNHSMQAHPDNEARNLKDEEIWDAAKTRKLEKLQRALDAATATKVVKVADAGEATAIHTQYATDLATWEETRADWVKAQELLAATEYKTKAQAYLSDLKTHANSAAVRDAAEKFKHLQALTFRAQPAAVFLIEPDSAPYLTCGAEFVKATIQWAPKNPVTMEDQVAVLNQMSQHLDRISSSYISLPDADVSGAHVSSLGEGGRDVFPSIGIVNVGNYRSKILEIRRRVCDLDTLRWPMLKRSFSMKDTIPSSGVAAGSKSLTMGGSGSHKFDVGAYTSPYNPYGDSEVNFFAEWNKYVTGSASDDDDDDDCTNPRWAFSDGECEDFSSIAPAGATLYRLSHFRHEGVFKFESTPAYNGALTMKEFTPATGELHGDGNVRFTAEVNQCGDPFVADSNNEPWLQKKAEGDYILDHIDMFWERSYSGSREEEELGLPNSLSVPVKLVAQASSSTSFSVECNAPLLTHLPATQIDVNTLKRDRIEFSGRSILVCKPTFPTELPDEPVIVSGGWAPQASFSSQIGRYGAFGMMFPLPSKRGGDSAAPFISLRLFHSDGISAGNIAYGSHLSDGVHGRHPVIGLWDCLDIEGDRSEILAKTTDAFPQIQSWSYVKNESRVQGLIEDPFFDYVGVTPISEVVHQEGKVKLEWLAPYHFKLSYLKEAGEDTITIRTYEVKIVGFTAGQVVGGGWSGAGILPYPAGFETVTVWQDGKLWARAISLGDGSSAMPVEEENYRVEYYNDSGIVEHKTLYTRDYNGLFGSEVVKTTQMMGSSTIGGSHIRNPSFGARASYRSISYEDREITESAFYESGNIIVYYHPDMPTFSDWVWGHSGLTGAEYVQLVNVRHYSDEYLASGDNADWKHLPLLRYPKKQEFVDSTNTPTWARHGEEIDFDQGGSLTEHRFKVAGMAAVRNVAISGNSVTETLKVDAKELTNIDTTYAEGLSKVTRSVLGVDTVVEYYTDDSSGGFPWMVKSVTTPAGVTTYSYSQATAGDFTVTATYDPEGADSNTVTTTKVNNYGNLVSTQVKSGTATISSITATGHSSNAFLKPTSMVVTAGGVTRSMALEYYADGSIKKTNNTTDEVINNYVWDVLGRLKNGTTFDGLAYQPNHSGGLTSSQYSLGGKDFAASTDVYGKLTNSSHELGAGLSVTQDASNEDQYTSSVPGEGNRGAESVFRPDGLPDVFKGGLGSPGVKYDYGVATVNTINCLTVTRTLLNELNLVTSSWETSYYDGYGRLMRTERPHPQGPPQLSQTNYSYDIPNRTVTITPPIPSKPITIAYSSDWKQVTTTQGGTPYISSSETTDGVVKNVLKRGAREIYSDEANLATGDTSSKVEGRNEVNSSVSANGKEITIAGPHSSSMTATFDKYGLQSIDGSVRGESFGGSVDSRDSFGRAESITIDPSGPGDAYVFGISDSGRLENVDAPGTGSDASLAYDFQGGGVKVTVDSASGDQTVLSTDARGHLRDLKSPDRPALQITGDALSGSFTLSVPGQIGQSVAFTTGPFMNILSKTRSDTSGTSFDYHADGTLDTFTRFDGLANGGGNYEFDLTEHPVTGFPTGFIGPDSQVTIVPDNEGRPVSSTYASTDIDGNNQSYFCFYQDYLDERPGTEIYGGQLSGYKVVRGFDPLSGELDRVELWSGATLVHAVDYTPDISGRLSSVDVTASNFSSSYDYTPGYLHKITSGSVEATRNLLPDGTARLSSLSTSAGGAIYSATYSYDGNQKRDGLSLSSTGRPQLDWTYAFTGNQLQNATAQEGAVVKQSYAYGHDVMGNRTGTNTNVSEHNQYDLIRVPGAQSYIVKGKVTPGTSVTIKRDDGAAESTTVAPDGTFLATYPAPITGASPVTIPIEVIGTLPGAGTNGTDAVAKENRTVVLRPSDWSLSYGAHGALGADWRWVYRWNSEGRLAGLETRSEAVASGSPNLKLKFSYDDRGRRIQKTVLYLSSGGNTTTRTVTTKFVYDDWNLIGEFTDDSQNGATSRFYTWGMDLDGSIQGMGGVGGLLAVHQDGVSYVPVYDANGNIIALCNASNGTEVAHWSRGPFGEPISSSGNTTLCPFGFATHYTDAETGLVYFGYRYYSPLTGRWISREPLGEFESFNLYAYCHNDPVRKVDVLGLHEKDVAEIGAMQEQLGFLNEAYETFLNGFWGGYKQDIVNVARGQITDAMRSRAASGDHYLSELISDPRSNQGVRLLKAIWVKRRQIKGLANNVDWEARKRIHGNPDAGMVMTDALTDNFYQMGRGIIWLGETVSKVSNPTSVSRGSLLDIIPQDCRTCSVGYDLQDDNNFLLFQGTQGVVNIATVQGGPKLPQVKGFANLFKWKSRVNAPRSLVSETQGAVTNLGTRTVQSNAKLFDDLPLQGGMSGVYDHSLGRFVLRPSTDTLPLPTNYVRQTGGHAAVRTDLGLAIGEDLSTAARGRLSGFYIVKEGNGSVRFGWNSGQVNPGAHGARAVPEALRGEIETAVRAALGL